MTDENGFTWSHGGLIRGRRSERKLALVFTGGDFGEGSGEILDTLRAEGLWGSFFFTGDFLRRRVHREIVERAVREGHYVGPHSDRHLLYCAWDDRGKTLVTREEFGRDLRRNVADLVALGVPREEISWWIPPFEWFNETISAWALEEGFPLFCFTSGTLSHTDYTETAAANYRSSQTIFDSIVSCLEKDPDGLNGFFLLSHVGAGEGRPDKFFRRLPDLIGLLRESGYAFARIDEMTPDRGMLKSG